MPQPMRSSIETWQGSPASFASAAMALSMGLGPQAATPVASARSSFSTSVTNPWRA